MSRWFPRAVLLSVVSVLVAPSCGTAPTDDGAPDEAFALDDAGALVAAPDCAMADLCTAVDARPQCFAAAREASFAFEAYQRFDAPRSGTYSFLKFTGRRLFLGNGGTLRVQVREFSPAGPWTPQSGVVVGSATLAGGLIPRTNGTITVRFDPPITLGTANAPTPRYAFVFDVPEGRLSVGLGCTSSTTAYEFDGGGRKLTRSGSTFVPRDWLTSRRSLSFAFGLGTVGVGPCSQNSAAQCDDGNGTSGDGCSASCQLEAGFACSGQPSTCSDVDECAANTDHCDPNATCTNTVGSFTCACKAGFAGSGTSCAVVNPCSSGSPCNSTGLVMHLDASNAASYDGSAQYWRNLEPAPADGAPASAYDFFRGTDASAGGEDPAFVGTPGGGSAGEYFRFDGGQLFRIAAGNTPFIQSMHKDGARFTIVLWVRTAPSQSGFGNFIGTLGWASGNPGFLYSLRNGPVHLLYTGTYASAALFVTGGASEDSRTYMLATTIDEPAGTGFLYRNGQYDPVGGQNTFVSTYVDPSALDSACAMELGNAGCAIGDNYLGAGTRIYAVRLYNKALTKGELDSQWNALRGRFGL